MAILLKSRVKQLFSIKSPIRLLLIIIFSVCVVEFLIMLSLAKFDLQVWEAALIDSLLVFIVMFTLLYKLMILPLINQISARKKALKSLKLSEDRYRNIFRNIQDVYFEVEMDGIFTEVSPSIKYLSGGQYYRKHLIGKSIEEVCIDHEEHVKLKEELMRSGSVTDFEFPVRNADGKEIPCSVTARLIYNEAKEPVMITGSMHNISQRKQFEAELVKTNEQLRILNNEKDKLFSIIAHDLKSPFNAFLGLTSLMADEENKYTLNDLRRLASMVNASATNLHQLLDNLLQWSQIKRNTLKVKRDKILLLPVVNSCVDSLKLMAESKNISVHNYIEPDLAVIADELMIKSVIRNLLTNAIKFTHRDGRIVLNARPAGKDRVEISVEDTGIGIEPGIIENLFRIDVKTNRQGTEGEPSTGLGLLLSKEHVEMNNGKIWVQSSPGKGTTFYFTLQSTKGI